MFDFLYNDISYVGLFFVCFLSSTLLPLASEAFVVAFVKLDFNIYYILFVSSFANTLGSMTTYALAYFGKSKILEKYFNSSLKKMKNIDANFNRFGFLYAFLAFLPLIGDIFALGLGFAKYSPLKTGCFIALGKISRYVCVIIMTGFI
ncbi:YqaA family protein [Campylobacter insulaenigrae]|uniref:Putative membrane protein, YqaA family (SNARE domain) n=1 Tax=Campylobacter insulaenigrae NCTC 12927 TaxID=1031564 RepID=A0A0A8H3J2_9BACT|nr:YqaA family protein [Campylobacter insulaenigrae]AJC88250.1 putative membrane protein, YqaA family (SNARE domain) [Campylobacter insulaenigrae NCTC 12927]MCR6594657.1 DedA family protein [Campylobacter insulaenigrae]